MTVHSGKKVVIVTGAILAALLTVAGWLSWDHLHFWLVFESLAKNAQGYPEYKHRKTGIVFVRVPGTEARLWGQNVTLEPFLIAKTQIKQSEWEQVMRATRWRQLHLSSSGPTVASITASDSPLPWPAGEVFCEMTGLSLPTKAQWTYAYTRNSFGLDFPNGLFFEWCQDSVCYFDEAPISDIGASPPIHFRPAYFPLP